MMRNCLLFLNFKKGSAMAGEEKNIIVFSTNDQAEIHSKIFSFIENAKLSNIRLSLHNKIRLLKETLFKTAAEEPIVLLELMHHSEAKSMLDMIDILTRFRIVIKIPENDPDIAKAARQLRPKLIITDWPNDERTHLLLSNFLCPKNQQPVIMKENCRERSR